MNVESERPSPCRLVVNATVSPDEVAVERHRVVGRVARKAQIDGFRQGKAPRSLVERRYAEVIREELEEELARIAWRNARENEKLVPASPFGIRESTWLADGGFQLVGEYDVYPEVDLPSHSDFVPPPFSIEPTEDEVTEALARLRERHATWEPVSTGAVEQGMLVEAEVDGSYPDGDGEPFHQERSLFEVGRQEVYPEIEGAVIGRSVGDEATAERVVGEEGGPERKGQRIAYRLTIKSLRRKRIPDADDGFAASFGVEDGAAALRTKLGERLAVHKLEERRGAWRSALVGFLSGDRELPLPEYVVTEETRKSVLDFAQRLASSGVDPEQAKVEWNKVEEEARGDVQTRLRAELLLDALADRLGITASPTDVDAEVERQAKRLKTPFAELKGNLAKGDGLERVAAVLRRERAVDSVLGPFVEKD